jgi:catechol 2,3-dioxygenase-like lactoylglutathione lyase family enzyme
MRRRIGLIALLVKDYDEAISFFVQKLGFTLKEDSALSAQKRWVVVSPGGDGETARLETRPEDVSFCFWKQITSGATSIVSRKTECAL